MGDGVYVTVAQSGEVELMTSNGVNVTNRIYLEPEVWNAMLTIVASLRASLLPRDAK